MGFEIKSPLSDIIHGSCLNQSHVRPRYMCKEWRLKSKPTKPYRLLFNIIFYRYILTAICSLCIVKAQCPSKVKFNRKVKFHLVTLTMLTAMKEWHLARHVANCTFSKKWCKVNDLDMEALNGIFLDFQKIRFNAGLSIHAFYYECFLNLLL